MMEKKEPLSEGSKTGPETPKPAPQRRNTAVRRRQIVETLRKVILRHGIERLTVKRLAEEIGFSGGALYRHFKSKREVLLLLVDDLAENLNGDIEKAGPVKNPLARLGGISQNLLSPVKQRKGASLLIIAEIISLGDRELNQKISGVLAGFMARIRQIILEGVQSGEIREDVNVDMAAAAFFGMLQGMATIGSLTGFPPMSGIRNESVWKFFSDAVKKENGKCAAGSASPRPE